MKYIPPIEQLLNFTCHVHDSHSQNRYPVAGFGNPLLVCCGNGGGEYNFDRTIGISCGRRIEVNGTSVLVGKSCNDPSKSVSWDGVHFTEAANKFVFNQIVNGALSDPPVPLSQACQGKGQ